jgi:pyridoxamine 5'-phosphate oxidase
MRSITGAADRKPSEKDHVVADRAAASISTGLGADFTLADDPFALFEAWFAEATASEPNDPNAMVLSTVDADGLPNVRVVLLKGLDGPDVADRGFVFYTNTTSAKGRELAVSGKAAVNFHWKSLLRQVRVRGLVAPVSAEEADAYYDSRPRGSRLGAWASQQSQPLADRATLEAAVAAIEARYPGDGPVPRPPHWSGYRLTPLEIEFWADRPFRLHDRAQFQRSAIDAPWSRTRLFP